MEHTQTSSSKSSSATLNIGWLRIHTKAQPNTISTLVYYLLSQLGTGLSCADGLALGHQMRVLGHPRQSPITISDF